MLNCARPKKRLPRRRGAIAVQFAIFSIPMFMFTVLAIDVGSMYVTKSELQRAADNAALAAAAKLADYSTNNPKALSLAAAQELAMRNEVLKSGTIVTNTDVEFGRAVYDMQSGKYGFMRNAPVPTAVRVSVRRTSDSPSGPMNLYFAPIFGRETKDLQASATAMILPRDIALVTDLSGSQNDDSELKHYKLTEINLWDIWHNMPIEKGNNGVGNGLDAQPPGNPAVNDGLGTAPGSPGNKGGNPTPGAEGASDPNFQGPLWGYFMGQEGFGSLTVDPDYDVVGDPGLIYLPYNTSWTAGWTARQLLTTRGYSEAEVEALLSNQFDGAEADRAVWENRVAVTLRMAVWNSGIPGGLWEQVGLQAGGDGDGLVGSGEIDWTVPYPYGSGNWRDYIDRYMNDPDTKMVQTDANFKYRYGVKTFVNYLMEDHYSNEQIPDLALTPAQPLQAVKDSVAYMMNFLGDLKSRDWISLEVYATTGRHEVDLTNDFSQITDRLNNLQAGHYDAWTNMAAGIIEGYTELTSSHGRDNAAKVMILLTDGKPNVDSSGNYNVEYATERAMQEAAVARSKGIQIYTVSVGADANIQLMEEIANIGGGEHFHTEGSIENYSAQLDEIFVRLGTKRQVILIE